MKDIIAQIVKSVVKSVEGAETGQEVQVDCWIDTGNYALNKIISGFYKKGFPVGRVVDIFGDPSTGKSLLIYHVLASVQKMGGIAILDDTEDAYMKEFGEKIGIDNSDLIRLSSLTVEEHFEKIFLGYKDSKGKERKSIIDVILKDAPACPIVVALDSLALLSTRHEQEVKFERPDMIKAKQIRAGLRMASSIMKNGNILHIISNHVIAKMGVLYGPKTTTPGGSGVPFQASVRLELSKGGKIKENEDKVVGIECKAYTTKNKVSSPFKNTILNIYFDKGVDSYSGLLDALVEDGVIKRGNAGYHSFGEETFRTGQFKEFFDSHPAIIEK
mgnify:CR=1 FL=1